MQCVTLLWKIHESSQIKFLYSGPLKLVRRIYRPHLVFQAHEAVSVIVGKGGLRGIPPHWIARVSIGKSLNRECWSCKHILKMVIKRKYHHHQYIHFYKGLPKGAGLDYF